MPFYTNTPAGVPWNFGSSYQAGTVVLYTDDKLYAANALIAASTPFVVGTTGATWREVSVGGNATIPDWITAHAYAIGEYVNQSNKLYKSLLAHTSGTFATDLAANRWVEVSPSTATIVTLTQAAHGFAVGDWVAINGGVYVKASGSLTTTAEVVGRVATVPTVNTFTVSGTGSYLTGLVGLTAGPYYLSATVPGTITTTAPSLAGLVSKPVFVADSATSGYVLILRGAVVGSPLTSPVIVKNIVNFNTTEPAAPAFGDTYINTGSGVGSITGAQTFVPASIYRWLGGPTWEVTVPANGWIAYNDANNTLYTQDTSVWSPIAGLQITPWVTTKAYAVNDYVNFSDKLYRCAIAHTSGTFATDLTAVRWVAIGTTSTASPDTNTFVQATNTGINFQVNGVSVGNMTESGGVGKLTWPGIIDPVAYAGTPQTIAQRDALVVATPLLKAGYLTYVVDTGVSEYQVWDGAVWKSVGSSITDWATAKPYSVGNYVNNGNKLYKCVTAHTAAAAFNTDFLAARWVEVSPSSADIASWVTTTVYAVGNFVVQANKIYKCLIAHTAGTFATDLTAARWVEISPAAGISDWATASTYTAGDYVNQSNKLYKCLISNTSGVFATDLAAAKWVEVSKDNTITDWVTAAAYLVNDYVNQSNKLYKCLVSHTAGTFATDLTAANWVEVSKDNTITDWATATSYLVGDYVNQSNRLYKVVTAHTSGVFAIDLAATKLVETSANIPSITDWATATAYLVNDYVRNVNRLYKVLTAHTSGTFATDFAAGSLVEVSAADIADWASAIPYTVGNYVNRLNKLYKCGVSHTAGTFTTDLFAGKWVEVSPADIADWATSVLYVAGNYVNNSNKLYKCIVGHGSGTFATDLTAGKWVEVSKDNTITDWVTATSYLVNDYVNQSNKLYKVIVAHTSGTFATDLFAGNLVEASPADIADWVTGVKYYVGNYVNNNNNLYKCLVAHTAAASFITDLTAANWVAVGGSGAGLVNWAATTLVATGEQKLVTIGGTAVVIRSLATRTTGATFDATEAAFWVYMSQSYLPAFPASQLVIIGFQFRDTVSGLAWQATSIHTTAATFSPAEQALWQGFTPFAVSNWVTTTVYSVGQQVIYAGQLLQCLTAHTSTTVATDVANWTFVSTSTIPVYTATTYYFVGALVSRQDAVYRRITAGTAGATFDVTEAANWFALTASKDVQTISANTTLTAWDQTIIVPTGGVTLTLPTAVGNTGGTITIHRIGGTNGDVTFTTNAGEQLDGTSATPPVLAFGQSITLMSDGAGVQIVSNPETVGQEVFVGSAAPTPYAYRRCTIVATGAGPFTVANPVSIPTYAMPYTLQLRSSFGSAVNYTFASNWVNSAGLPLGTITLAPNSYRMMLFMTDLTTNTIRLMVDSHAGSANNLFKGSLATTAALIAITKASIVDGTAYTIGNDIFVWRPTATTGAFQPTDTVTPGVDAGWWVKIAGRYAGLYSSTAPYNQYDIVLFGGELYFSNFTRDAGTYGASPTIGVGASSFTKLPGVIKPQFTISQNYAVGDLVYDSLGLIGTLPGVYRVDVAYTNGNLQDPDNFSPILVRSIYRGVYGTAKYLVGDVVTYDNKFYTCAVAHGSNNFGGPFTEANWTPTVYPRAAAWAAAIRVGAGELRVVTINGTPVLLQSASARTTNAAFDVAETANWTYVSQSGFGTWLTGIVVVNGFRLLNGSLQYAATSGRTTGATFNDAEKAFFTVLNPVQIETRVVTANYTVQAWDELIYVDTTAGDVTITLPNTLNTGKKIVVHKLVAANNMIVAGPTATGLITSGFAAAASESFASRYTNVPYVWSGTYWHIYA